MEKESGTKFNPFLKISSEVFKEALIIQRNG
jgi:hypothetical protein